MARVRKSKKSGNSNEIKIIKPRRAYSGINWLELFQTIEGGKRGIISKLAKDLNIPRTTLSSRYHRWLEGGLGIEDTNTGKRNSNRKYKSRLSENQQLQLYEWIIDNRRAGIPISSKDLAREAWQRFLPSRAPRISESWVRRFRKKFHLVLRKSCLHQTLPKDFDARKETEIFHKRCEEIMSVYTYQSIYNMDETNFRFSYPPEKTISPQGAKEVYVNHYGSPKEGCTVVGCIGGDGYKLPLTFIFKGGPRVEKQMRSAIKKGYFYANKAAWMTKVLMKKWFEEVFLKNVATPCALFMDNFKAHFDPDFLTLAEKHHVLIQMIPANLTGQLQPLDKMIFRQLKVKYQRYFEGGIKRGDTAQIKREKVSKACMKMWDQVEGNSVARSFRKTGIIRDNIDSFDRECLELFIEASNSNSKYERKKRKQYKKKKKTNSLESKKEKHPKKRNQKEKILLKHI
ncbi:hypothetical protein M0811_11442 [Anaeramoeba ignava]|uniref:HTH CENPB-type domain-containing protein n=1 Tax=Anaeramoeba ignava TaxID=1746090 RepID=A0A9Q0LDK2_ANAIG|nr:hypothetical protein M0811_11442 [Anaeramoeba ignava]